MTTWFTSDQHFGHENIIRYCDRPFASAAEMDLEIVTRWNDLVQPEDTVYVLGDFALGRTELTLPRTSQLAGRKILVPGNHDRCWSGKGSTWPMWELAYLNAGFAEIHQGTIELTLGRHQVRACHFPSLDTDAQFARDARDPFAAHRPADDGRWLLHGHVHEKWLRRDRMINVGVDVWDFFPVSESELVDLIEQVEPTLH